MRSPELNALLRGDTNDTVGILVEQEPLLNQASGGTGYRTDIGPTILVPLLQ